MSYHMMKHSGWVLVAHSEQSMRRTTKKATWKLETCSIERIPRCATSKERTIYSRSVVLGLYTHTLVRKTHRQYGTSASKLQLLQLLISIRSGRKRHAYTICHAEYWKFVSSGILTEVALRRRGLGSCASNEG